MAGRKKPAQKEKQMKNKLKKIRTEKGLSQGALAELAGVTQPAISQIERGLTETARKATMEKIIKALKLPLSRGAEVFPGYEK